MKSIKFRVTADNVNHFVEKLHNDYPMISKDVIIKFFGEGEGDDWIFQQDFFPEEITYSTLVSSFESWAFGDDF